MTIPELLIVVLVFSLLLVATLGLLNAATRTERGHQSRSDALDNLRVAMARLTKDLRQASSVAPSSTSSRLQMVTLVGGASKTVVYEIVGGNLRRRVDAGGPQPVIQRVVTSATHPFCYDPPNCTGAPPVGTPPSILIVLEVRPDASEAPPIKLATTIKLRNA